MRRGLLVGLIGACVAAMVIMLGVLYARAQSNPHGALDTPPDGAVLGGSLTLGGWALDAGASSGTGVDRVEVYVDDALVDTAQYGVARPDIATAFGAHFADSGWTAKVDATELSAGPHRLEARAHSTLSDRMTAYASSVVVQADAPAPPPPPVPAPSGAFDVPDDGAVVTGPFEVRGWAVDPASTDGPAIDRVEVFVDGRSLGLATYGAERSDVAATFGGGFAPSGWSASIDLRGVAPFGVHTLEVRAHGRVSGRETAFSRRIDFEAATAPHGSIDEPADGATLRAPLEARGWVLDEDAPQGTGVDQVTVSVDGTPLDGVEYGYARPEIGAAYGERFADSGWRVQLDVTQMEPGEHTLEVHARSPATGKDTLYSRRFSVGR